MLWYVTPPLALLVLVVLAVLLGMSALSGGAVWTWLRRRCRDRSFSRSSGRPMIEVRCSPDGTGEPAGGGAPPDPHGGVGPGGCSS